MAILKKVFCKNCKKPIYRNIGRFNENLKFGWHFYCSRRCEYRYKTRRRKLICENCGKSFERELSQISSHNYCSQSCAAIMNNKKYPKTRRTIMLMLTCINCGEKYRKSKKNIKYCSIACRRKAEQRTPEELIKIIKETAKKLKRVPARRELEKIVKPCIKIFGSWNNAVLAAGFIPNRSHDNRMYKRASAKALDGHLCDSVSELLIDNWFIKNKIKHERNISYPDTNHRADWAIFIEGHRIFIEYFGLANDSPRYDRAIKVKEILCKKQNISLMAIYPQDLYRGYLDINLKNKFKGYFIRE